MFGSLHSSDHPISWLASAPVYLSNGENITGIRSNFKVSNPFHFLPPPLHPAIE